ncbi:hypothetical protein ACR8I7_22460, partial [Salmonella enterica subsp. enterica serovar Paratyphi A]
CLLLGIKGGILGRKCVISGIKCDVPIKDAVFPKCVFLCCKSDIFSPKDHLNPLKKTFSPQNAAY